MTEVRPLDSETAQQACGDAVTMLRELIRIHPTYGSVGQLHATELLCANLRAAGWPAVELNTYCSAELVEERHFVDVTAFGPPFEDDPVLPKRLIIAHAQSGSDGPGLMVNCHYDVEDVSNPLRWRHKDFWRSGHDDGERIFGRGAADMLGGLAAAVAALQPFVDGSMLWNGRLVLVLVPDEEIGGNGTLQSLRCLEREGILRDGRQWYCLIPEPTEQLVATDSFGFSPFSLSTQYATGHLGGAVNGWGAFGEGVEAFAALERAISAVTRAYGFAMAERPFVTMGRIEAGDDFSLPPAWFRAQGVLFTPPGASRQSFEDEVVSEFGRRSPAGSELSFGRNGFDGTLGSSNALSDAIMSADDALRCGLFSSPCDARLYADHGIAPVIFGPGSLRQAHSTDEYILKADIEVYIRRLMYATATFFNAEPRGALA